MEEFIKSLGITDINVNDKALLPLTSLSFVIPSKKLAIDICSAQSVTESRALKFVHKKKYEECTKLGYRLITMYDDEWRDRKDICKSRISHCLGITGNKIGARECVVAEISNSIAMKFCEQNHIQGRGQSHYALGIYKSGDLLSVMTFTKPSVSKNSSGFQWELNRFCSLLGYSVVGGATKLFSFFRKKESGKKIITFSDLRWGTGGVYAKLGFKFEYTTDPNYYYCGAITEWKRKHRFNFTKSKLVKLFGSEWLTSTEFGITDKNGINRIWDCGHMKFSMTL